MSNKELATVIVRKLVTAGYTAYFAGGWVRDYLMGHPSDDIDIATDAPPEKILSLFPKTIPVGLAFGVIIVLIEGHPFEVATFRRDIDYVNGRKPSQIELATPEEDAERRDFTINGMFYDPLSDTIYDFVHGKEDIKHQVIRAIGDPYARFVEDRLRMIRAVRFAARFAFVIDPETETAIIGNADTLFPAVAMERVWQELCKMAKYPHLDHAIIEMHRLGLLPVIFPALSGVHLDEIRKRVLGFTDCPSGTAPVLYLMQLFPKADDKEAEVLCVYLHISNIESALAKYYALLRQAIESEHELGLIDMPSWVHKYAHPSADLCLHVFSTTLPKQERDAFLLRHHTRKQQLAHHIERIQTKTPIVSAALLQEHGIKPGRQMGILIKEAERIAILQDLTSSNEVLSHLKSSHLWIGP